MLFGDKNQGDKDVDLNLLHSQRSNDSKGNSPKFKRKSTSEKLMKGSDSSNYPQMDSS